MEERVLVCIGLGGICEGYLPHVLLLHQTGVVQFRSIHLVDGKQFREQNRARQHFLTTQGKAVDRRESWSLLYPEAPVRSASQYVDRDTVSALVTDGSIVLLSPDNHATRKVVSNHAETLDNILLISGGNDGIDAATGEDGTDGAVIVHWRTCGRNRTPPITTHHPEIREPADRLPSEQSCGELAAAGQPQVLATNLLVGHAMVQMLQRYVLLPPDEAARIVEFGVNSREGTLVPYGIAERPLF